MAKKKGVLREIFSGSDGRLSSKRVIGGIAMGVVLACTTSLVIRDGSTEVVENLLMTIYITSASLLGLPSVTGIWNKSKLTVGGEIPDEPTNDEPEEVVEEKEVPNCDNCYFKQRAQRPNRQ